MVHELDPEAAVLLAAVNSIAAPPPREQPIGDVRAAYDGLAAMAGPVPELASVEDGSAGEVPIRAYRPVVEGDAAPALVVYFHGGGHTIGSLDGHDPVCRQLAARSGCLLVAVDYRLGPEHPFPAAVDDAVAATSSLIAASAATKVAVCGDSAGGNLAAVVAQVLRDRLAFQALVYPAVDYSVQRASYEENGEGYFLTRATMEWFRDCYAPDPATWHDPRLSPLLGNLTGLPPALVVTAGFDPLRDEGHAYVEALRAAGVEVVHRHWDGSIHPFFQLGGVLPQGDEAVTAVADALRSHLR